MLKAASAMTKAAIGPTRLALFFFGKREHSFDQQLLPHALLSTPGQVLAGSLSQIIDAVIDSPLRLLNSESARSDFTTCKRTPAPRHF